LHITSAFIFYFGLGCFCAIYTGGVFRLLPLILFVIMLIQTVILKKG